MSAIVFHFGDRQVRGFRLATIGARAGRALAHKDKAGPIAALVACADALGLNDQEMRGVIGPDQRARVRGVLLALLAALDTAPLEQAPALSHRASVEPGADFSIPSFPRRCFRCSDGREARIGSLYAVQSAEGGPIKIGFSANLDARFSALRGSSPVPLRLLAHACSFDVVEPVVHQRLRKHRLHGEWFNDHADVHNVVLALKAESNAVAEALGVAVHEPSKDDESEAQ